MTYPKDKREDISDNLPMHTLSKSYMHPFMKLSLNSYIPYIDTNSALKKSKPRREAFIAYRFSLKIK